MFQLVLHNTIRARILSSGNFPTFCMEAFSVSHSHGTSDGLRPTKASASAGGRLWVANFFLLLADGIFPAGSSNSANELCSGNPGVDRWRGSGPSNNISTQMREARAPSVEEPCCYECKPAGATPSLPSSTRLVKNMILLGTF